MQINLEKRHTQTQQAIGRGFESQITHRASAKVPTI